MWVENQIDVSFQPSNQTICPLRVLGIVLINWFYSRCLFVLINYLKTSNTNTI
jgi:hypothetical protein